MTRAEAGLPLPLPTRRLCLLAAWISALFLLEWVHAGLALVPLLADASLLLLFGADAILSARARLAAERRIPARLGLGKAVDVVLAVESASRHAVAFEIADDLDDGFEGAPARERCVVLPGATAEVRYRALPVRRGRRVLGPLHLRAEGPLGLAWTAWKVEAPDEVAVYPGGGNISTYERLVLAGRTRAVGIQPQRALGAGAEFSQLRDYRPGDDPKHMDWKSSARRRRLTWRDREPERQQEVLLLLDTGRAMTARWRHAERLEVSLEAAALLAWVVASSHDKVGVVTFSSRVHQVLPPGGGVSAVGRVREVLLDASADLTEPDFREAFGVARTVLSKRSLLVLFSEPVGTAMAEEIREQFAATARRHRNLLVTMRDPSLFALAEGPTPDRDSLARRAAAESLLQDRARAIHELRARGVLVVDSFPDQVTPGVVNSYLALKSAGGV